MILVAVDASKEITDYALEWAVRNVARASDSLILLALLPSQTSSPASPNIRSHRSKKTQFFSCKSFSHLRKFLILDFFPTSLTLVFLFLFLGLLKKLGIGHSKEGSSNDDIVLINGVDHDVFHRVNNVCAHMMQQLCSVDDLKQVIFFILFAKNLKD